MIDRVVREKGFARFSRSQRVPTCPVRRRLGPHLGNEGGKRFGRPRENCHFSAMSLAEIKAELKTMNRAERLTLVEYVEILNRLDEANVREEVNAAMQRMDAGRKVTEEEVLDAHQRLLAEGR
jgi:hypothetical protein